MRFPKPCKTVVDGVAYWLVRTPKAMGGGREYCQSKADAENRIKSFRQTANSALKEFTALPSGEQAMLLGLVAQFDGDVRKLKAAADLGAGKLPTSKPVRDAVKAFLADHHAGAIRKNNLAHILDRFVLRFGDDHVADVETLEIERWMNDHKWGPKMWNDVRQALNQFWKYAISRLKCATVNPVTEIAIKKVPRSIVPIYSPTELKAMLNGLKKKEPELIPTVALSGFAGLRLSEVARLPCEQVREAMKSGHLEIKTHQAGKTLEARIVPILPNLKAWLEKCLPKSGPVLPARWNEPTKTKLNRLDELGRYIERKTGVEWKANGLRHSYGTYRFKIVNDVGQVVDEMGTSLRNFERHYRNRSKIVTPATAHTFWEIRP